VLRDITASVTDGLLGLPTKSGTGIHVKIGVSPIESATPITITGNMTATKIRRLLGLSPLADKVIDSVENGSNCIYCVPVTATASGEITKVSADQNVDGGTVALSGSPYNAYSILIKITGRGGLNSALFEYSIDGGNSYSEEQTVPISGEYELSDTGLKATFTAGTADPAFEVDDIYQFTTTAPPMTTEAALSAIDKLRHFDELFEFVHIVGESPAAFWVAVAAKQVELQDTYKKPLAFVLEAYAPDENETTDAYVARLSTDSKVVRNYDIQVVAARSLYIGMDGVTREINNAGIVCGLYSCTSVQQSIGRTAVAAGMSIDENKMLALRPAGIDDYIEQLDAARYLMFRRYSGLSGYFVYNARMMSPDGSDYRYMEDSRVKNKVITEVRKAGLPLLQDDIDLDNQQKELEVRAEFLKAPLDDMVTTKEISSATVTVPEGQDIQATETMEVVVRYKSRGYIREILVDIGRATAN